MPFIDLELPLPSFPIHFSDVTSPPTYGPPDCNVNQPVLFLFEFSVFVQALPVYSLSV